MFVERPGPAREVRTALRVHPCAALTGPRQCGKTTLARRIATDEPGKYFDLESAVDRRRLDAPEQALGGLADLVVIDEVQRMPVLFETLRVLVDRPCSGARFLLLGSASPALVRGVSESLAGRVGLVDLGGFTLDETGGESWRELWLRGGFPRSFLAHATEDSAVWRRDFVRTFLERDIPQLGITIPAERLRQFWTMVAHYHGQTWNGAEFARSLGTGEGTARRYLDLLAGAFMVRVLPPWFENLKKRQVKAPKVYVRDTGLLHSLLGLSSSDDLAGHPKRGPSFEGFVIEQLLASSGIRDAYYWATHGGAELDLLLLHGGRRYGVECNYADAPGTTRSMRVALADLRLDHLWIVYPGDHPYALEERISVVPVREIGALAARLTMSERHQRT